MTARHRQYAATIWRFSLCCREDVRSVRIDWIGRQNVADVCESDRAGKGAAKQAVNISL
jgi:hypothetical protein